jgi:hypothetical protein
MTIRFRENQYQGMNAHLHSIFQTPPSQWTSFHQNHITDLTYTLNSILPVGYRAYSERSLQIRLLDLGDELKHQRRIPDVTIFESGGRDRTASVNVQASASPTWEATLADTFPEMDDVFSVVVYQVEGNDRTVVARLELLAPTNKIGGSYATVYEQNRWEALNSGLPLVEIDYLHESQSPIHNLPDYHNDPSAYPYHITITDPRLPPDAKSVRSFGFKVDEPMPSLPIPLLGEDSVLIDFNAIYQRTFDGGRWGEDVDYATEPLRMETYREDDQAKIRGKMKAVQESYTSRNE